MNSSWRGRSRTLFYPALRRQIARAGAGEGRRSIVGSSGPSGRPPGEPARALLVEDPGRPVEQLGELDAPAGAALDRVVGLNPADREDLIRVVDHVVQRLEDAADEVASWYVRPMCLETICIETSPSASSAAFITFTFTGHSIAWPLNESVVCVTPCRFAARPNSASAPLCPPEISFGLARRRHGRILSERLREIEREYTAPNSAQSREIGHAKAAPVPRDSPSAPRRHAARLRPGRPRRDRLHHPHHRGQRFPQLHTPRSDPAPPTPTPSSIPARPADASDTITLPNGTYPFVGQEQLVGGGGLTIQSQTQPLSPFNVTIDLGNGGRFLQLLVGGPMFSLVWPRDCQRPGPRRRGRRGHQCLQCPSPDPRIPLRIQRRASGGGAISYGSTQDTANLVMHNGTFFVEQRRELHGFRCRRRRRATFGF